jgi:hypothetical protein
MSQKYAAYDSTGVITGFYDSVDSPVPSSATAIGITDAQWQTCINQPGCWSVTDDELVYTTPAGPTLADAQATVKQAIRNTRDNLLLLTPFQGKQIQTDVASKIQIMVLASQTTLLPSAAQWRTADNSYLPMTLALFQSLMATIMTREGEAYGNSAALQDEVDALTTVAAVQAFDYSIGWPT